MSVENERINNAKGYYNKALQKYELANYCIQTGKYQQAVPLDYYYIFNLCRIIYSIEYKDTSSHKTLLGDFNKIYVHEKNIFDRNFGSFLHTLEKQRGLCDYEANYPMDKEFALYLHEETSNFATILLNYIKSNYREVLFDKESYNHTNELDTIEEKEDR